MIWALLGLGSNIEPEAHLSAAVAILRERFGRVSVSAVYQSPPADGSDQSDYMNAAALVYTRHLPGDLKQVLRELEKALGRVRTEDKYAARTIDLDILLYGTQVFDLAGKHVPDWDLLRRSFVAIPAADLLPSLPHPETGEALAAIAYRLRRHKSLQRVDVSIDHVGEERQCHRSK